MDRNCMELVAAGWCTRKWLRFNQNIRNLTCGDQGIPFVEIQLEVTGLKKARSRISQTCLREGGRRGSVIQCVGRLQMIGLMLVYVDVLFTFAECGFIFWGSWSFSEERVWNLGTKSTLHCSRKVKCQLGNIIKQLSQDVPNNRLVVTYWLRQQKSAVVILVRFSGGQNIH